MIKNITGYAYRDLTLVPSKISSVKSRSECNCLNKDDMLPIWTAPMASVISNSNSIEFKKNKIRTIIPRNIPILTRLCECAMGNWVALSLKEFNDHFVNRAFNETVKDKSKVLDFYVCVDIANGHMQSLYEACKTAKDVAKKNNYKLTLMTGNIANPDTYKWIIQNCQTTDLDGKKSCVIDYIRVGIGGGFGCFVDGTKVKTIEGEKNIEDIKEGDLVLTIDNTYHKVIDRTRYKTNNLIKINNEIISTNNHEYFVINKVDKDKVTEDNIEKYGYWVPANKLNNNIHLLVKKY